MCAVSYPPIFTKMNGHQNRMNMEIDVRRPYNALPTPKLNFKSRINWNMTSGVKCKDNMLADETQEHSEYVIILLLL